MTAQVYKLDDYRKVPRGPVQHEIAMDPDAAHRMREEGKRFEQWKASFLQQLEQAR